MAEASSSAKPASKLKPQDLSTLNVAELDALSPQVISRQATINIGARAQSVSKMAQGEAAFYFLFSGRVA